MDETTPRSDATIKCVVWDLDNTVWSGVLLEGSVELTPGIRDILVALDERGILHSIASRNDEELALEQLRRFGIDQFFVYPKIGWSAKSASLQAVAGDLNIGLDTFAFVDDDPFERAEVAQALPDVLCIDAAHVSRVPVMDRFNVAQVTDEMRNRRSLYQRDAARRTAETEFSGASETFLAGSEIVMSVWTASRSDLDRAAELTLRTNQLNATGKPYSNEQLGELILSPHYEVLMVGLCDRFGDYGTIGLALLRVDRSAWTVELLLTSCRVISRGIGTVLLTCFKRMAKYAGVDLFANFVDTGRNRIMYIAYSLGGFREVRSEGKDVLMKADPDSDASVPLWLRIDWPDAEASLKNP